MHLCITIFNVYTMYLYDEDKNELKQGSMRQKYGGILRTQKTFQLSRACINSEFFQTGKYWIEVEIFDK